MESASTDSYFSSIVLGAGISGLTASSVLRDDTLLIDRLHRHGGTSYVFRRGDYVFPTGPLGFSHPYEVNLMLNRIGLGKVSFSRKRYEIIAGKMRFVIPESLDDLGKILGKHFPEENFDLVIKRLREVISETKGKFYWGDRVYKVNWNGMLSEFSYANEFPDLDLTAKEFFEEMMDNELAVNFMSSLGFKETDQSLYASACMWDIMCETGIWYPESGLKKLVDSVFNVIGGIRFLRNSNVEWLEKDGEKFIVGTDRGEFASNTVISSLDPFYIVEISHGELRKLRKITEGRRQGASVLTVYLSSEKVAFEGNHALYYPWMDSDDHTDPVNLANITNSTDPDEAFRNREIEITPLSMLKGFGSGCILRAGMEYEEIKCKTREEYYEVKMELAEKLAETVRHLIGDYRIVDVSTPITYEVWGGRVNGSVVGWRWDDRVPECLIKTDVDGFYIAGMYSFTIPFLGGFPTSMLSGVIAGEIANKDSSVH